MPGTNVRGAEKRDIPRLAEVLALAFYDDPSYEVGDTRGRTPPPRPHRPLYKYCMRADLKWGGVTTTRRPTSLRRLATPRIHVGETLHHSTLCACSPATSTGAASPNSGDGSNSASYARRSDPRRRHHYLDFIGVHPDKQGQGYASALLHHTLTILDSRGEPAYFESSNPRNNPLYHRHGFQTTDEIHLPDGPTLWCMWRKPQNNATCNTI